MSDKMIADYTKAGQEMQTATQSEKVSAPTDLGDAHQRQLQQLIALRNAQIDEAYESMQVKARDDAMDFPRPTQSGPDGALKDFAEATLPTLQMHQQMIHKMARK